MNYSKRKGFQKLQEGAHRKDLECSKPTHVRVKSQGDHRFKQDLVDTYDSQRRTQINWKGLDNDDDDDV